MTPEQLLASAKELDFPDISAAVLLRIAADAERRRRARSAWLPLSAAAALLALAGASPFIMRRGGAERAAAPPAHGGAAAWLVSAQEASGAWNPARFGGSAECGVAVSAVAALALLESPDADASAWRSVHAATEFFRAAQTPRGFIGARGAVRTSPRALAAHALASSALIKAYETGRFPGLFTVIDGAVQFARDSQRQDGAWCADARVNECMASVLSSAAMLGWRDDAGRLRRARAALGAAGRPQPRCDWLATSAAARAGGEVLARSLAAFSGG